MDGPTDKRRGYYETPATEEERRAAEVEAMARGKRLSVSNAHVGDCECPRCKPGEW